LSSSSYVERQTRERAKSVSLIQKGAITKNLVSDVRVILAYEEPDISQPLHVDCPGGIRAMGFNRRKLEDQRREAAEAQKAHTSNCRMQ
jgi:hypothetical protein